MNNSQALQGMDEYFFRASIGDLRKIPGNPIAYWTNESLRERFVSLRQLSSYASPKKGLVTSDNERFLRKWFETSFSKIGLRLDSRESAKKSKKNGSQSMLVAHIVSGLAMPNFWSTGKEMGKKL